MNGITDKEKMYEFYCTGCGAIAEVPECTGGLPLEFYIVKCPRDSSQMSVREKVIKKARSEKLIQRGKKVIDRLRDILGCHPLLPLKYRKVLMANRRVVKSDVVGAYEGKKNSIYRPNTTLRAIFFDNGLYEFFRNGDITEKGSLGINENKRIQVQTEHNGIIRYQLLFHNEGVTNPIPNIISREGYISDDGNLVEFAGGITQLNKILNFKTPHH